MISFFTFLQNFISKLRLSKPWSYKIPLLISFPYLIVLLGDLETSTFNILILASIITVIGFAGVAYTLNDLSDIAKDKAANKSNAFTGKGALNARIALPIFLILTIVPWTILPFDYISILLIIIELLLFYLYSFRPFRLKERGLWGLICDALYAHIIPATLAIYTFSLAIESSINNFKILFISIIVWQLFSGIRNILSHQIVDLNNDQKSNTKTWVATVGIKKTQDLLKALIGLETLSFISFLVVASIYINLYISIIYLCYLGISFFAFAKAKKNKTIESIKLYTNIFLDDFYVKWIPLILLIQIIFIPTEVLSILCLHIILFPNILKKLYRIIINAKGIHTIIYPLYEDHHSYIKKLLKHITLLLCYTGIFSLLYWCIGNYIKESNTFFYYQKILSKILVIIIITHALSFFVFNKRATYKTIKNYFFSNSTAYNLSIFRFFFFFISLKTLLSSHFQTLKAWTYLPESSQVSLPGIGWLMKLIPISPDIYQFMIWLGIILSILGVIGLKTKWVIKLYIPVAFYLWAVPCFYGKLNHNQIMLWIPIILAFSSCSDVLSIDYILKKRIKERNLALRSIKYSFPLAVIWLHLGIIYCFSGFHKLWDTGLYWALSDNIINQIQLEWVENYDTVLGGWRVDKHPIMLKTGTIFIILFEIIYPIFLLKPFTRWINFLGSWTLHITASILMNIDFLNLRLMHFSLINWTWLVSTFKSIVKGKEQKTVIQSHELINDLQIKKFMNKTAFLIPSILLCMNIIYSFAGINSWPFSAYPAYSGIVKDEITLVDIYAINKFNEIVDVKNLGKQQNFRWENIRPFEERIVESYIDNDSILLKSQLENYWNLWENNVKGLENIKTVELKLVTTKLNPELRDIIISSSYLGKINLK